MLLTDKYADKIHGIITCYDRMIIQGYIPNWSHAEAMTAYMKLNGIRIFDYPTSFSQPLTEQVRQNAEKIAHENGMEIEFIRKLHAFRKDDRIQNIIAETGKTEGLILLWSSIFVTLMANKIGGLQFGIYRNCQISSRVFHTAVAALPLTKANRSDFE